MRATISFHNLATKEDLRLLEQRIETRMSALELRLTLRVGSMQAAGVVALVKLL
jgi:hypothetical protein